jgi:hypothetical protein
MKPKLQADDGLKVGGRVRIVPETLTWQGEFKLRGKTGEVIEQRGDGRVTIRFDNGRLLMGRDPEAFERLVELGAKAKRK